MVVVTTLPRGRAFTEADLAAMPDDGNRYELIDGALIVTPSTVTLHQIVAGELHLLLRAACPDTHRVLLAPYDVRISSTTAGCASYGVVDPNVPSLTAWELGATGYVETGVASGAESLTLARPFAVTVVPSALVA